MQIILPLFAYSNEKFWLLMSIILRKLTRKSYDKDNFVFAST